MKRIYLEVPPATHCQYISAADAPGFVIVNTLAPSADVPQVLYLHKGALSDRALSWLHEQYILQQCKKTVDML